MKKLVQALGACLMLSGGGFAVWLLMNDEAADIYDFAVVFFIPLIGSLMLFPWNSSNISDEKFREAWSVLILKNGKALRVIDVWMMRRFPSYRPQCFWSLSTSYLVFAPALGLVFGLSLFFIGGFTLELKYVEAGLAFGSYMGLLIVLGEWIYRKVYGLPAWEEFCASEIKVAREDHIV